MKIKKNNPFVKQPDAMDCGPACLTMMSDELVIRSDHSFWIYLRRHPYIDYRQAKLIVRLRRQPNGLTGWHDLTLAEEFSDADRQRLKPYLSFDKPKLRDTQFGVYHE